VNRKSWRKESDRSSQRTGEERGVSQPGLFKGFLRPEDEKGEGSRKRRHSGGGSFNGGKVCRVVRNRGKKSKMRKKKDFLVAPL